MNIFKILASGSGSINEPNVSAFLGYLLNPKEDHGLGDTFLRKFLKPLLEQNKDLGFLKDKNLSIRSNFEMIVLLEKAFKDENGGSKQIVDIVILCYEKKSHKESSLAEEIIKQKNDGEKNTLKHIFLIENKIKGDSVTEKQLKYQYANTITTLESLKISKDPEKLVSVIFVTPEGKKSDKEFEDFKNTGNKCHLFWNKKDTDDASISKIIREIIKEESQPIDAYCKYTLHAFLEFIENGFQSKIAEESESKGLLFLFEEEKYTRPKLAEKVIKDYIKKYEEDNGEKITSDKLGEKLSSGKKINKTTYPFCKVEDAQDFGRWTKNGKDNGKYFLFYNNPIPIEDAEICIRNGWSDEKELQDLLDKTTNGVILDEIRIK